MQFPTWVSILGNFNAEAGTVQHVEGTTFTMKQMKMNNEG